MPVAGEKRLGQRQGGGEGDPEVVDEMQCNVDLEDRTGFEPALDALAIAACTRQLVLAEQVVEPLARDAEGK